MKVVKIINIIFTLLLIIINGYTSVFAETLESPSYKIEGFTIGSNEDAVDSPTYKLLIDSPADLLNEHLNSTSYKMKGDLPSEIEANIPIIQCFETVSTSSSLCLDSDVSVNGMEGICGGGGCYDRARFEIDSQGNPSDTLYSIQITTDPLWGSWNYVDGSTKFLETVSNHNINDYLTKADWEGTLDNINIYGLSESTTYYIRITALHGDFTESGYSTVASSTTGFQQMSFSVYSGDSTGIPEYEGLNMFLDTQIRQSSNYVWLNFSTNNASGVRVFIRDTYSGLYSSSNSYTIPSVTGDLSSIYGFGVKTNSFGESGLGPVQINSTYNQSGNIVGGLSNNMGSVWLANSSQNPVVKGTTSIYLLGKIEESTPVGLDYEDTLIFTLSSDY